MKSNILKIISAIVLFIAVFNLPYVYYQLLRWVVMIIAGYLSSEYFKKENNVWGWFFVSIAILFNPIFPFYFSKNIWIVLNIISAAVFIISINFKYDKTIKVDDSKKTWWFRLLKILFSILVISSFVLPIVVFQNNKPVLNKNTSVFSLKCDNKNIWGNFNAKRLSIDLKSFGSILIVDPRHKTNFDNLRTYDDYYYSEDFDNNKVEELARIRCHYNVIDDKFGNLIQSNNYLSLPSEINYQIILSKPVYSDSWFQAILYTSLVIFGIILVLSLIRAIFYYVIFGENFWKIFIEFFIWLKEKLNSN